MLAVLAYVFAENIQHSYGSRYNYYIATNNFHEILLLLFTNYYVPSYFSVLSFSYDALLVSILIIFSCKCKKSAMNNLLLGFGVHLWRSYEYLRIVTSYFIPRQILTRLDYLEIWSVIC